MENTIKILEEKTKLPWVAVDNSSNIEAYSYNSESKELWVLFKKNRANHQWVYVYHNISKDQLDDLQKAESKGKWVNANLIKPGIKYDKYELVIKDSKFYE